MKEILIMTHTNESRTLHRGQVYYVNLGMPDGTSKQAGIRPCVLVGSEISLKHSPVINILAFSSSPRKLNKSLPVHIFLSAKESGMPRDGVVLCEQPMTISKNQLERYVTTLTAEQMERISEGIKLQLSL